jgi:hypothetical protein
MSQNPRETLCHVSTTLTRDAAVAGRLIPPPPDTAEVAADLGRDFRAEFWALSFINILGSVGDMDGSDGNSGKLRPGSFHGWATKQHHPATLVPANTLQ